MTSPVDTLKEMRDTLAGHAESMTGAARDGALNDLAALDAAIAALSGGEAVAYAVYGNAEEYGPVLIPEYCGSEQIIRERVMEKARREGFTGTFAERMAELGWWPAPLYTTPRIPDGIDGQVIALLVAGGFVSQAKVDEARNIAISAAPGDEGRGDGGWRPIETAPKDGTEFQAWVGYWESRCRFNDDGVFQIWGRVDYDMDGWDYYAAVIPTHWMPIPAASREE